MNEHVAACLANAAGTAVMTLVGVVAIAPMPAASSSRARPAMYTLGAEHAPTRTMPDSSQIARFLLAVVAGSVMAGVTPAQTPPVEFKGVPLGSSEAQWRTAFPFFRCEESSKKALSDRACNFDRARRSDMIRPNCGDGRDDKTRACWQETNSRVDAFIPFGGTEIQRAVAHFRADRLIYVSVSFATRDYDKLTAALTAKYGQPLRAEQQLANRSGIRFQNKIARWNLGKGDLETRLYDATLDAAYFQMTMPGLAAEIERRSEEAVKANAKSL